MNTTSNNPANSTRVFDEFSPGKFILQTRSALRYLLSKWWIILLVAVAFGIAGAIYSSRKKPVYLAEITFALDEGATQSSKNDFAGLAEELGFGTALNAGGVFSSMTNIVELLKSRLLVEKTLRNSVTINNKQVVFADFFLDSLKYREQWMKGSPYYNANFATPVKTKEEELYVNNILRGIYETLIGQNISIEVKGKGTTIIAVRLVSRHELFSKYFLEALMAEVTHYYVETKTQRSKLNLDFIQKRTDSIRIAYNNALYGRASFTDANINPIRQLAIVSGEKQQTDVQILRASYIELVGALEAAKTSLMRDTPLIQYLDTPILPLKITGSSMKKYFIAFFAAGAFLTILYLVTTKGIRHILQMEKV